MITKKTCEIGNYFIGHIVNDDDYDVVYVYKNMDFDVFKAFVRYSEKNEVPLPEPFMLLVGDSYISAIQRCLELTMKELESV